MTAVSGTEDGCQRTSFRCYWIALPTDENTLLALEPIKRIVPTTITKMTASITAYSAMSWPRSSDQSCCRNLTTGLPPWLVSEDRLSCGAKSRRGFPKNCWLNPNHSCAASHLPIAQWWEPMARKCYMVQAMVFKGNDWLTANKASSRRVETPSLSKTLLRWCFTVSSLILKYSAISLLE